MPGPAVGSRSPGSLDTRVLGKREVGHHGPAHSRKAPLHFVEQGVQVRRVCPPVAPAMQGVPHLPGHPVQHGGLDGADRHEAGVGPRQLQDRYPAVLDPAGERGRTLARRGSVAHDRRVEKHACSRCPVVALDLREFALRLEHCRAVALRPARRGEQRRERDGGA